MSQNPGQDPNQPDPYRHDDDAARQERPSGYEAAPSFDAAGAGHGAVGGPAVAKPQPVGLAQKLMYAGGALSLVTGAVVLFTDRDVLRQQVEDQLAAAGQTLDASMIDSTVTGTLWGGAIFGVVFAAIWFLLAHFNGKGRGWARIVATILGALNVVSTVAGLAGVGAMPGAAPGGLNVVLSLLSAAIAAAVVFLLWRKESSAYVAATP